MLFLYYSCNVNDVSKSIYNISVDINEIYPIVNIRLKQIIPLELTNESAFKSADKIIENTHYYFVMDRSVNKIYVFDKLGKFIKVIDRPGNGPGEYTTISDINFDPYTNSLHILDPRGKLIGLALDDFSKVTDDIFFQGIRNVANFQVLNKDMIILYSIEYVGEKTIRFYSRKEDRIVKEMLESNVVHTNGGMTYSMSPFRIWNNTLKFMNSNTYHSFKIIGTSLIPEIFFDFGENTFDFNTISDKDYRYNIFNHIQENDKAFPISIVFENDEYLSFGINYDKITHAFIVSKSDHSIYKLNMPEYTSNLMDFLTICNGLNTDRFRGIVTNPGMAEKIFEKAIYDKAIENQINNLKSGDNPVIFEYDLVF